MKRLWLVVLFSMAFANAATMYKYGLVTRSAARTTEADWKTDKADNANERGYCIAGPMSWGKGQLTPAHDTAYFVWRVTPAKSLAASEDSLIIECGMGVPTLHTHPCGDGVCDCNPSREDYEHLLETRAEFAVVQCGPQQFVFYFPRR